MVEDGMNRTRNPFSVVVAACLLTKLFSLSALAGPLDDARAKAHLQAIAAGDIDTVMRDYEADAYMDWIGGPLDGRYRSKAEIKAVWQKFFAANAGQPRPVRLSPLEANANAKGATIHAAAEYGGTTPVKVWHALSYRDGSLTTEIWQIAPSIQLAP
jgi:ketosteroid isomerase-like protein